MGLDGDTQFPSLGLGSAAAQSGYQISPFKAENCYSSLSLFIYFQLRQLSERLWNRGNFIVIEAKPCQI